MICFRLIIAESQVGWAQALVEQQDDTGLQSYFMSLAEALKSNEAQIIQELNDAQSQKVDLGGYYHPDPKRVDKAMRPSKTLNSALD